MALSPDAPRTRTLRQEAPGSAASDWRRSAVGAGAVLATLLLGRTVLHRLDAPVSQVVVTGTLRHVRADEVRAAASPAIAGGVLAVDVNAVRAEIETLPWVARARVEREWPGRLRVRVWEREAFARWGEREALSTEAVAFAPGSSHPLPASLPRLAGPPGREREVMQRFVQMSDRLAETPFALTGLTLDARGEWTASTQAGVALRLGRADPLEQLPRLKSAVLPALASLLAQVHTIDLRYANGFAVGWRDGARPAAEPPLPAPEVSAVPESLNPVEITP